MAGGTYNLTSTPNDSYLRNFLKAGLFTERKSPKKYFFIVTELVSNYWVWPSVVFSSTNAYFVNGNMSDLTDN